jgi:hypothetical protein
MMEHIASDATGTVKRNLDNFLQAKAHRADKPQPLPAVESHVESRTSEDRISIKSCSHRACHGKVPVALSQGARPN